MAERGMVDKMAPSVAVAAHELKTPLALIRQLTLLLDNAKPEERAQIEQQIIHLTEQSLEIVQDITRTVNMSPDVFPLEPVNPLAVCHEIAMSRRELLRQYGLMVEWPRRRRGENVIANRMLLGRVLVNFIDNAVKYSESERPIQVVLGRRDKYIRIGVRDFGPMMSRREYREIMAHLTEKKTVKTRPESSGLGLYIASRFAQAMGGEIGVTRHRDGMTFYVDLPISTQMSLL